MFLDPRDNILYHGRESTHPKAAPVAHPNEVWAQLVADERNIFTSEARNILREQIARRTSEKGSTTIYVHSLLVKSINNVARTYQWGYHRDAASFPDTDGPR